MALKDYLPNVHDYVILLKGTPKTEYLEMFSDFNLRARRLKSEEEIKNMTCSIQKFLDDRVGVTCTNICDGVVNPWISVEVFMDNEMDFFRVLSEAGFSNDVIGVYKKDSPVLIEQVAQRL